MMGTNDPPLRSLSYKEIFSKFADGELSFRASLFKLIDKLEECDEKPEISRLFWKVADISVTNDTSEQDARERYQKVLGIMKELSEKIRKFESKVVFTDALADSLYMFSCTYTYFCQTESYKKFTGDEVEVRRWETPCDPKYREKYKYIKSPYEEEKIVYRGAKEYDPGYIWGQLWGWYKQSVDKPNASLTTDRRGTITLPDLDSFDLDKPLRRGIRPKQRKNNKEYAYGKDIDNLPDEEDKVNNRRSSSRRGQDDRNSGYLQSEKSESRSRNSRSHTRVMPEKDNDLPDIEVLDARQAALDREFDELWSYPHRKFGKRDDFLRTLKQNFSKQWDVDSKWNFKNKQKIYGSIQFESLMLSGLNFEQERLNYFETIVGDLQKYESK